MPKRLTKETLDAIRADDSLMLIVKDALDVQLASLPSLLTRNGRRLIEIHVLEAIAGYTGKEISSLIEEYNAERAANVNACS